MSGFRHLPVSSKLSGAIVATTGLGMLLAFAFFVTYEVFVQRAAAERLLSSVAGTIAAHAAVEFAQGDRTRAQETLNSLRAAPAITAATLRDRSGAVVAVYPPDSPGLAPRTASGWLTETTLLRQPVVVSGKTVGELEIVGDPTGMWHGLLWGGGIMLTLTLAAFLVAYVIGQRFRKLIADPIRSLAQTTSVVASNADYSARASKYSEDEIGRLVDDFNHMLDLIQDRDRKLVTQTQHLERKIRERTAKLVRVRDVALSASRAKSNFLANMSHEVRTPLNAIIGMTQLALQTRLSAKQRHYVEKAEGAALGLLDVVNDILDFSKIEAGKLRFEYIEFKLADVLGKVADIIILKAQEKGLEIVFDCGPEVPEKLLGDPLRLEQVLINLVNNAVKFTDIGEVSLIVRREPPHEEDGKDIRLHFAVRDTGIGMSEAEQSQIFSAFTQADDSTSRKYGGTGLGLAICQRLVTMMEGEIEVSSAVGVGSTFSFTARFGLPAALADTPCFHPAGVEKLSVRDFAQTPLSPSAERVLRDTHLLLVEDNALNQEIISEILQPYGIRLEVVEHGRDALARLETTRFDAVLMDCELPDIDGFETTRRLRRDPDLADLPVIALTAHAGTDIREQCLASGMNDHVEKPIDSIRLLRTLVRWLGGSPFAARPAGTAAKSAKPPELDRKTALGRIGGSIALYQRILRRFRSEHADALQRLRAALAVGDGTTAERLIHSLKGLSSSIGAESLHALCAGLEEAIRNGDQTRIASLLPEAERALSAILGEIARTVPEIAETTLPLPNEPIESKEFGEQFAELRRLLADNDLQAVKLLAPIAATLRGGAWESDFRHIGELTERYQFDRAGKLLYVLGEKIRIVRESQQAQ